MKAFALVLVVVSTVVAGCGSDRSHEVFLEGQVFWGPSKTEPVDRAFVYLIDAYSRERCVVTSCDGTFKLLRDASLTYPIKVGLVRADEPESRMPRPIVTRLVVSSVIGGEPSFVLFDTDAQARAAKLPRTGSCAPGAVPAVVACPEDRPAGP